MESEKRSGRYMVLKDTMQKIGGKDMRDMYNLHIMLNFTRLVPFTFK